VRKVRSGAKISPVNVQFQTKKFMANVTIQSNLQAQTEQISNAEQLEAVFNNPANASKIAAVREARSKGDMAKANKAKLSLQGLIFVADDFAECEKPVKVMVNDVETEVMELGKWRLQKSAHLNGLAVLDVDHLTETPEKVFAQWTEDQLRQLGVLLVFKTSSNAGLKFVFIARKEWGNLIDNACALARELGLKADESCKDASRMSFAPSRQLGDILFYDPERMFSYENPEYDELFGDQYRQGDSKGYSVQSTGNIEIKNYSISELKFKGVLIQKVVDCWVGPNLPEPGSRHKTSLELADHLRYICDSDPVMIESVLRAQSWIQDIIKERGENVTQTVKSALAFKEEKRIPKRMCNALRDAGADEFGGLSKRRLPYADWAKRLLKFSLGCYGPALGYIDDDEIKPGGVITAAGMYDTLLTKCWYQDWEGMPHRLNIMSMVIGGPASGKGFAVKQDKYIMEVLREADAPGREQERKYKESLNERETSQKEQRKEALKRPDGMVRYCPVKTSNNVTYRRMQNACIELTDGTKFYYHLYTFASELLSIIKASGSFQEKRDLMLQSFHNELNGVDYSNKDSVNGIFQVFYNWVMTGTSTALKKFVNLQNIGDGLATRFSCFVMPTGNFKMRPMSKKPKSMEAANEMKKWGSRMDSLHGEIKGLDKLVKFVYDMLAPLMEEAANDNDQATLTMLKRMQDKVMALCIPLVISTQKSWEEFQQTMTVKVTQQHLDFAKLMFEVLYACEDYLFGQMWQEHFENEERDIMPRNTYDKTNEYFQSLPTEFTTQNVMDNWNYSSKATASARIKTFLKAGAVKKLSHGHYQKLVSSI
jgi:hypothetical protein